MLYTLEMAKANIRTREGKRVFFLAKGDTLTPGARDYLTQERIPIRPAAEAKMSTFELENGEVLDEKPENMTHLQGNVLVRKDHPRIIFRGALDRLQAEILLCQLNAKPEIRKSLGQILSLTREMLRCEVLETPLKPDLLCGMTEQELRSRSHRPQEYYGKPHFMPEYTDGAEILQLNALRCVVRETERLAVAALPQRTDIVQALNRMSSMVYLLMIREK